MALQSQAMHLFFFYIFTFLTPKVIIGWNTHVKYFISSVRIQWYYFIVLYVRTDGHISSKALGMLDCDLIDGTSLCCRFCSHYVAVLRRPLVMVVFHSYNMFFWEIFMEGNGACIILFQYSCYCTSALFVAYFTYVHHSHKSHFSVIWTGMVGQTPF